MTSLKSQLINLIISRGYVSYGELADLAMREGYKTTGMDARLREICQPIDSQTPSSIEPTRAKSKRNTWYVNGYRYVPKVKLPAPYSHVKGECKACGGKCKILVEKETINQLL